MIVKSSKSHGPEAPARNFLLFALLGVLVSGSAVFGRTNSSSSSFTVKVPGNTDLWLAGMPDGSKAGLYDSAPKQSPIEITGLATNQNLSFEFSADGRVAHDPKLPFSGPDGNSAFIAQKNDEHGIGKLTAPMEALIGVFLTDMSPEGSTPPPWHGFRHPEQRDYLVLTPELRQPFFIGDGKTLTGEVQRVVAPAGATRLYLGVMDEWGWFDNQGHFKVAVTVFRGESK